MKTVILDVRSLGDTLADVKRVVKTGKAEKHARISFASVDLLWKVLAPNRMALVHALAGAGPVSIREAARRVKRDVRAVHSDITVLVNVGVLRRTARGVEFPYDAIHVDFTLKAA